MKKLLSLNDLTDFLVGGALSLLLLFSVPAFADRDDPLEIVAAQVARKERSHEGKERRELYGARWFVAGTNFSSLFVERKGAKRLLDWVGYVIPGFTPGRENAERKVEYLLAERIFLDDHFKPIRVLILVPHPKYAASVDMGLIEQFFVLHPPRLRAAAQTPVEIKGAVKSTLYQDFNGDFSLLMKLPKNAVIQISATAPGMKPKILDLASKLDIERLAQKMQS